MPKPNGRSSLSLPLLKDTNDLVRRLSKDAQDVAERVTHSAAELLPESTRRGMDSMLDWLGGVRGGVTKTAESLRSDINARFEHVRGRLASDGAPGETSYSEQLLQLLKLPVTLNPSAMEKRLAELERRLDAIEKQPKKQAKTKRDHALPTATGRGRAAASPE